MIDLHGLGIYEIDILDGKRIFNKRILLLQFPAQTLIDLHGLLNYEMIILKKNKQKKHHIFGLLRTRRILLLQSPVVIFTDLHGLVHYDMHFSHNKYIAFIREFFHCVIAVLCINLFSQNGTYYVCALGSLLKALRRFIQAIQTGHHDTNSFYAYCLAIFILFFSDDC